MSGRPRLPQPRFFESLERPSVISTGRWFRPKIVPVNWLIAHAFWMVGAAALLMGVLFSLHSALHAIRLRCSMLAGALVVASAVLWPARMWMIQQRPLGIADPAMRWIVTIALWLAIVAVPLAVIGRPRWAALTVIASAVTFVLWYRTAAPPEASVWSMLRLPNATVSSSASTVKPSPALTGNDRSSAAASSRTGSR